jgi:hypothetical protein
MLYALQMEYPKRFLVIPKTTESGRSNNGYSNRWNNKKQYKQVRRSL